MNGSKQMTCIEYGERNLKQPTQIKQTNFQKVFSIIDTSQCNIYLICPGDYCRFLSHIGPDKSAKELAHKERQMVSPQGAGGLKKRPARVMGASRDKGLTVS